MSDTACVVGSPHDPATRFRGGRLKLKNANAAFHWMSLLAQPSLAGWTFQEWRAIQVYRGRSVDDLARELSVEAKVVKDLVRTASRKLVAELSERGWSPDEITWLLAIE